MYLRLTTALAAICLAAPAFAGTDYPLEFDNCGVPLRFDAAPERVASIGQAATEVLYALDLADKVTGTGVWFTDVLPEYAEVNARVPRLADNDPSFESIVQTRPDLVASQYEWFIGPQGIIATREQFADLAIPTYIMAADCAGKDNTIGSDGTRTEMFTMDSIWQGITDLAAIFDVPERGEALIAALQAREAAAIEQAQSLDLGDASALFWFSSAEMDIDPYVAGRKGPPAYMMEALGLRNVIESDEEWPTVAWETIARANPTVIVIAKLERRRFPADDFERKLEFLRSDPVASQMDAVINNRIVVMDGHSMDPSIRNVMGLEQLAEALAGYDLK
ncbi:MAG: ABC transporter substrate-binding protein [Paracoccus sp. (in: a-proteobacteria)]|uniref:ABC transporter substrate-binding protein n=1 Tax=Paracoccus sp. TaxID=267 RepID=UPI0026E0915E|nr:ABC transporter substrate-binding protein [Paracoccus sp. (in: a-proteobacteria)]MDO5622574.1 ABC transporter substrate-binding protein [Paracoccus sp. (in: a-proteobacteria)]